MKNFNLCTKYHVAILSILALVFLQSKIEAKTFTGDNFQITYPAFWDTLQSKNIIAKYGGLSGVSLVSCIAGTQSQNLDSVAQVLGDSLGGHFTKGNTGLLTLGKYQVNWVNYKYDSLPKLSKSVQTATGFPVSLKNDSIRIYSVVSGGFIFTGTLMTIITNSKPPYADMETAIATLTLGTQAGAIREITGRWGGAEMWVRDGRLGGAWFSANSPKAIDCYNLRGSWVGEAIHSNSTGIWVLPSVDRNAVLLITLADGSRFHLPIRN